MAATHASTPAVLDGSTNRLSESLRIQQQQY